MAVSYTHLDVYKRQVLDMAKVESGNIVLAEEKIEMAALVAVSYTHLDVYKRQVVSSCNWPIRQAR